MPRVGSKRSRMRLSANSHLAMAIFCWLPPEKAPPRVQSARRSTSTRSEDRADGRGLALAVDQARARQKRSITGMRGVVLAGELEEQPLGLAVLRHEADADVGADRIGGRVDRHRPAVDADLAPVDLGACRSRRGRGRAGPCPAARRRRGSRPARSAKLASRSLPAVQSSRAAKHLARHARAGRRAAAGRSGRASGR